MKQPAGLSRCTVVYTVDLLLLVVLQTVARLAKCGVKLIALRCAGFDRVDLEACEQHGIKVSEAPCQGPGACRIKVAVLSSATATGTTAMLVFWLCWAAWLGGTLLFAGELEVATVNHLSVGWLCHCGMTVTSTSWLTVATSNPTETLSS